MRKLMILFTALMAMLIWMPLVQANPEALDGDRVEKFQQKMEERVQELYKDLGVSEEQKKMLTANKDQRREKTKELWKAMRAQKDLMRAELQKEQFDVQKLQEINNQIKLLQGQMADERLEGILEVRKILTAEQFKQFMDKMEEGRQKSGDRFRGGEFLKEKLDK